MRACSLLDGSRSGAVATNEKRLAPLGSTPHLLDLCKRPGLRQCRRCLIHPVEDLIPDPDELVDRQGDGVGEDRPVAPLESLLIVVSDKGGASRPTWVAISTNGRTKRRVSPRDSVKPPLELGIETPIESRPSSVIRSWGHDCERVVFAHAISVSGSPFHGEGVSHVRPGCGDPTPGATRRQGTRGELSIRPPVGLLFQDSMLDSLDDLRGGVADRLFFGEILFRLGETFDDPIPALFVLLETDAVRWS